MIISRKWLADYVKVDCDLETLCRKITMAGIEVESVEDSGTVPSGVVAGKILERKPHPDSDHMSVCRVDVGAGEPIQIVCGAPNCDAGHVVPVAVIGTVFNTPEGEFKIKKSKLRGVESCGMMCSAKELGISEDNSGLLVLDSGTKLGTPVNALFPGDTKIDVEVTPNRPDWLSIYGIARDVSCLFGVEVTPPEIKVPAAVNPEPNDNLVTVEASELCPRYIGRVIRGVKIGPSPDWLRERLEGVGLRSINNVVDVTNFVLMELGQPLHSFDLGKLAGGRVVARRARSGEKIVTLDGKELTLEPRHLVIADAEKPMALAGVMGGEFSGVTDSTTDVLIESAVFVPANIRSTSRELGIASDSSYRFERGVDFDTAELAADRAAQLIIATAGGRVATEKRDVSTGRPAEKVIRCRFERIRALLGSGVSNERIVDILRKLHLKVENIDAVECTVTAPLFRPDLSREADLAEEVGRIDGLDKIPEIPVTARVCAPMKDDAYWRSQQLRDRVISLGFYECLHYSMVSEASALADTRFTRNDCIELKNPISQDLALLRPGLLGEMLGTLERNISRRNLDLRLFELDKAFCRNPQLYPEERNELCLAMTGHCSPERYSDEAKREFDFYDLKGAVETLMEVNHVTRYRFVPVEKDARFAPGMAAELQIEGKYAGAFGRVADALVKGWRTPHPVYVAVLDADILMNCDRGTGNYKPFSLFPATSRDVAFVAPESLRHDQIIEFIRRSKLPDFESARLFDVFVDDKLKAEGRKSMAYEITFRSAERTLKDAEVNACFEKLRAKLAAELKVELR